MTLQDIIRLNRARASFGRNRQGIKPLAVLFVLLVALLITVNVSYITINHILNFFVSERYPHDDVLTVFNLADGASLNFFDDRNNLTQDQVNGLKRLPGVRAIQTEFYPTSPHFFDMDRVNHFLPSSLVGYDAAFFRLYQSLPNNSRDVDAIPILLSEDIFLLSYVLENAYFIANAKTDMATFLGRIIHITINPLSGALNREFFVRSETLYKKNALWLRPQKWSDKFHDSLSKVITNVSKVSLEKAQFNSPLTLRFQVVGYFHDKAFLHGRRGFGIIPSDHAQDIHKLMQIRSNQAEATATNLAFLLCPVDGCAKLTKSLTALGLLGMTRTQMNSVLGPILWRELRAEFSVVLIVFASILIAAFVGIIYIFTSAQIPPLRREIGILRCVGAKRADIRRIFGALCFSDLLRITILAIFVSNTILIGTSLLAADYFGTISLEFLAMMDLIWLSAINNIGWNWLLAPLWVQLLAVLLLPPIGWLASIMPAQNAARIDPVEAMR